MTSGPVEYRWTAEQDWFSGNIETWSKWITFLPTRNPRLLEIGSWEGRSAVWLLENACKDGGEITCIDHFDLMTTSAGEERYAKITHNLSLTGKPHRIIDDFSVPALYSLLSESISAPDPGYDFLYIDGSHEADDTFLDGELAWRMSRKGAIVIFDDYNWSTQPVESRHHPKRGIDGFMELHRGEFEVLSEENAYQVVLRKLSEMRIGFLSKEVVAQSSSRSWKLTYEVNIAFAVDSDYAMPLSVAIRSALDHTSGRVTIYVLDCGLSGEDRDKLAEVVGNDGDATLVFLPLPSANLTEGLGKTWGKIDLLRVLPVERVLYLDADTMVRSDLRELWDTDLEDASIGAAPDVGYPLKSDGEIYFNAGVLLIDLVRVRKDLTALINSARRNHTARIADQDVLSSHFTKWKQLSLRWNAQGLGTYADLHSPERSQLPLDEQAEPSIIHFTGPLHPSLADVLNPWVPYVAKPWGYAGAPRHPFAESWWDVLDRTPWRRWRAEKEAADVWQEQEETKIKEAIAAFGDKVTSARPQRVVNGNMSH